VIVSESRMNSFSKGLVVVHSAFSLWRLPDLHMHIEILTHAQAFDMLELP